jgi:hypothetical protein
MPHQGRDDRVRVTAEGRLLLNQIAFRLADALYPMESPAAALDA